MEFRLTNSGHTNINTSRNVNAALVEFNIILYCSI